MNKALLLIQQHLQTTAHKISCFVGQVKSLVTQELVEQEHDQSARVTHVEMMKTRQDVIVELHTLHCLYPRRN